MKARYAKARARALRAAKTWVLDVFCFCGGARLLRWLSRRGFPRAVRVLYCHDILPPGAHGLRAPGSLDADELERRLRHLQRHYGFVSIEQALPRLRGEQAGGGIPVLLTFDDGYRSFAEQVHPVVRRLRIPVALFVTTAAVGGSGIWSDDVHHALPCPSLATLELPRSGRALKLGTAGSRARAAEELVAELKLIPDRERRRIVRELCERAGSQADRSRRMLTWDELRRLSRDGLITVGSHTMTHPILSRMGEQEAEREIRESKHELERELGVPVTALSYPNGCREDFTEQCERAAAGAGYRIAFSTMGGVAHPRCDLYAVPRGCLARERWSRFVLQMAGMDELIARARSILRRRSSAGGADAVAAESSLRPSSVAGDLGEP